jgi:uncharacterized membrane protein
MGKGRLEAFNDKVIAIMLLELKVRLGANGAYCLPL